MPIINPSTSILDDGIYNPSANAIGGGISASGGGASPPPPASPGLDFSIASNSMYIPLLFGHQIK